MKALFEQLRQLCWFLWPATDIDISFFGRCCFCFLVVKKCTGDAQAIHIKNIGLRYS